MGLYTKIYSGAGIMIKAQKEKSIVEQKTCGCKEHYHNEKFCSECGNKIQVIKIEKEFYLHVEDLIGSENFFHKWDDVDVDKMFLMSNFGHGQIDIEQNKPYLISQEKISELIREFKNKHKDDIKLLETKINSKIEVGFYLLQDYT